LPAGLGAWFGWANLPWILFFPALTGAAFGIMRAVHKGQSLRAQEPLPFGPFLAIGGLLICLHEWRFFGSQ
jgi:leader peptidase (prepilin peptidase) / N-methyltransferase